MTSLCTEEIVSSSDNRSCLSTYFDTVPFVGEEHNIPGHHECIADPVKTEVARECCSRRHSVNEGYIGTLKHFVKRRRKRQENSIDTTEANNKKEHRKAKQDNNYKQKIPKSLQNLHSLTTRKKKTLPPIPELVRNYVRRLHRSASELYKKNMNIEPVTISSPARNQNKLSLRSFRLDIGNLGPLKRRSFTPHSENILVERYFNADNNSTIYLINDKVSQTSSRLISVRFDNTYEVPYHSFYKKECENEPFQLKMTSTCDAVIQTDGKEERH